MRAATSAQADWASAAPGSSVRDRMDAARCRRSGIGSVMQGSVVLVGRRYLLREPFRHDAKRPPSASLSWPACSRHDARRLEHNHRCGPPWTGLPCSPQREHWAAPSSHVAGRQAGQGLGRGRAYCNVRQELGQQVLGGHGEARHVLRRARHRGGFGAGPTAAECAAQAVRGVDPQAQARLGGPARRGRLLDDDVRGAVPALPSPALPLGPWFRGTAGDSLGQKAHPRRTAR